MFLPVDIPVAQSEPRMGKGTDRLSALVELQLCCGRNLRFDREIDTATLTRLIHAVEAA
ncbi:transposase (fragment) [Mesorhizobium plurifarium]|uniref:Transposase n=1 Tax=Mesorhizobium plurifarium TaxID=69974 RepID=A0A090G1R1_MESPL